MGIPSLFEAIDTDKGKSNVLKENHTKENIQDKIHIKSSTGSTSSDGCGQMAAAESWPLVGSWPCSLAVTKVRGESTEVGLYVSILNCPLLRANTDKLEANEPC